MKKFSNGNGECQGNEDEKKMSLWDKDVLVGNTARATFKVLQVTHLQISSSTLSPF